MQTTRARSIVMASPDMKNARKLSLRACVWIMGR
jgi:hypothetical protein